MLDSIALNVVISLVFIYLLYSLLVTTIHELLASFLKLRAKTLEKGIKRMLTDNGGSAGSVLQQFYDLPIIKYLGESDTKKPSYLASTTFSTALVHLCKEASGVAATATNAQQQVLSGIQQIKTTDPETGKYLETLYNDANGKIEDFQKSAESWFNETMDRATGWYKQQTQIITLVIALLVAIAFNADSISIARNLSTNPKLASSMADMAVKYNDVNKKNQETRLFDNDTTKVKDTDDDEALAQVQDYLHKAKEQTDTDIKSANTVLGLGWDDNALKCIHLTQFLGWVITALAISLGSPFWFDILNKLMQLRGSKKIEEKVKKVAK